MALVAVTVLSLAVNVFHLLEARRFLTAYAINAGPTLAMVELARPEVEPGFQPGSQARGASPREVGVSARDYLRGTANLGADRTDAGGGPPPAGSGPGSR